MTIVTPRTFKLCIRTIQSNCTICKAIHSQNFHWNVSERKHAPFRSHRNQHSRAQSTIFPYWRCTINSQYVQRWHVWMFNQQLWLDNATVTQTNVSSISGQSTRTDRRLSSQTSRSHLVGWLESCLQTSTLAAIHHKTAEDRKAQITLLKIVRSKDF